MLEVKQTYQGSAGPLVSYNPATGKALGEVSTFTIEEAREAVERAREAQCAWGARSLDERIRILRNFQHVLTERAEEVCELIMLENGKPLQEAMVTEVLPVVDLTSYFCNHAKSILADRRIPMHLMKHRRSLINYRPRGVMLVISPWNFPFTIPTGEIVMGLLAGNVVVHKPASLTPLIALKARELFDEAGLPQDVYQIVPTQGSIASEMIEMGVDYVNFTGSTAVGRQVAERCGRLLIPSSMELGGKDPLIVCADANLESAAGAVVWGGLANAGQVCASVERVYAHENVYDRLVQKVVAKAEALRLGNPGDGERDIGAMVDEHQLDLVERQVEDAVSKGAKVLVGGKRIDGPGNFFEPTILVDVTEDMEVVTEETFGPVVPIMKVSSDEEAIEKANDSIYGLNAYVYTSDRYRGQRIARRLQAGTVMVNEVLLTHGCPETPWQGCKLSGTGRVHSDDGLRDMCFPFHINDDILPQPESSPFWHPYSESLYRKMLAGLKALYGRGMTGRWQGVKELFGFKTP